MTFLDALAGLALIYGAVCIVASVGIVIWVRVHAGEGCDE